MGRRHVELFTLRGLINFESGLNGDLHYYIAHDPRRVVELAGFRVIRRGLVWFRIVILTEIGRCIVCLFVGFNGRATRLSGF